MGGLSRPAARWIHQGLTLRYPDTTLAVQLKESAFPTTLGPARRRRSSGAPVQNDSDDWT
jgi:hypothetical protein